MNASHYEEQYNKIRKNYGLKLQEVEQRKKFLKEKNTSSSITQKKEYITNSIQNKLDAIDADEERSTKYYYEQIKQAEEKLETAKKYCMDAIERIKEKNDTKRNALELKKNTIEVEFDETSDPQLIKLQIELKELKEVSDRAEEHMNSCVEKDRVARRDKLYFDHLESVRLEALANDKKTQEEARKYNLIIEQADAEDAKRYALEEAAQREAKLKSIVQENQQLGRLRAELKAVWNAKQEKKYNKLSRDERLGFLKLSIDSILAKLN